MTTTTTMAISKGKVLSNFSLATSDVITPLTTNVRSYPRHNNVEASDLLTNIFCTNRVDYIAFKKNC